jgi:AcrR family transcriptional regulator
LNRDDYFGQALDVLGTQGSEGLTIAALCDGLHVTKGSFYHHFVGMPDFVDQLLVYWEREHSERLIELSKQQRDPSLRIGLLTEMGTNLPHTSESAIRAWGRSNSDVAVVVERVDQRREQHVADSIAALGLPDGRARLLARLSVDLLIGIQTREVPPDPVRVHELLGEIQKVVLAEVGAYSASKE